jgi:hypothetical protein
MSGDQYDEQARALLIGQPVGCGDGDTFALRQLSIAGLAAELRAVAAEARAEQREKIAQAAEQAGKMFRSTDLTEFAAAIRAAKEG